MGDCEGCPFFSCGRIHRLPPQLALATVGQLLAFVLLSLLYPGQSLSAQAKMRR